MNVRMERVSVIDDFLPSEDFSDIQNIFLTSSNVNWFFYPYITFMDSQTENPKDFQFVHMIYDSNSGILSNYFQSISKLFFDKLGVYALLRIKANLNPCSNEVLPREFHTDFVGNVVKHSTTSIYYINTNNGYTLFEDGTKIESVANRLVTFPSYLKHTGTSCTDQKARIVLNFNYFTHD